MANTKDVQIRILPSSMKLAGADAKFESKVTDIIKSQILPKAKAKAKAEYYRVDVKIKPTIEKAPKHFIAYLLRKDIYLAETVRVNVDKDFNVTETIWNYDASKEEDDAEAEADSKGLSSAEYSSYDFIAATPVPDIPTAKKAVEDLNNLFISLGFKSKMLLGPEATVENYKNYLTSGLKGFVNVGHGNTNEVILYNGSLNATWFNSVANQAVKPSVVYFNSCQVFNDPLKSAVLKAGARTFIGGIVNLLIGPSEAVCVCFWTKILKSLTAMGDALHQCEKDKYPQQGAHGIGGDTGLFAKTTCSELCVGSNGDGRLEVFAVGSDKALWHIWQTAPNNGWSSIASLGGIVRGIQVGKNKDGRLEVLAIGSDNALWHIWQTAPNSGWSGWASLGGIVKELAVSSNADGRLEVFAAGSDNALWHIWQTAPNNGWSGWGSLKGIVRGIQVGRNKDGRLEVFVIGSDNALWHIWQTAPNSGWSGWGSLGGIVKELAVSSNADGRLEVFAVGSDNALWHIWQTAPNNGWSGWASLGGVVRGIKAGRNKDGRLEVFAIGSDNALWHIWQTAPNSGWSGWGSLGGVVKKLSVSNNADGRLELFAIGSDDAIWHIWQTAPNNGWSGWAKLS